MSTTSYLIDRSKSRYNKKGNSFMLAVKTITDIKVASIKAPNQAL